MYNESDLSSRNMTLLHPLTFQQYTSADQNFINFKVKSKLSFQHHSQVSTEYYETLRLTVWQSLRRDLNRLTSRDC